MHQFNPWVRKIPWKRKWQPIPLFLLEEFQGQRSLEGYSALGPKESDTTEYIHICIYFIFLNRTKPKGFSVGHINFQFFCY